MLVATSADLRNREELVSEVKARSGWSGGSIAELFAELYSLHGFSFLEKLDGGFSLALWDSAQQQLMLAIDQLGLETLFWTADHGRLLFASQTGRGGSCES